MINDNKPVTVQELLGRIGVAAKKSYRLHPDDKTDILHKLINDLRPAIRQHPDKIVLRIRAIDLMAQLPGTAKADTLLDAGIHCTVIAMAPAGQQWGMDAHDIKRAEYAFNNLCTKNMHFAAIVIDDAMHRMGIAFNPGQWQKAPRRPNAAKRRDRERAGAYNPRFTAVLNLD